MRTDPRQAGSSRENLPIRSDIFQLQMYLEAALSCTGLDSLAGLRVLDIGCGNGVPFGFLCHHFEPLQALGVD